MAAFTLNIFFLQEQAAGFTAQLIDLEKTRTVIAGSARSN